jgi:UDP-3-O-[3-hydroxymyristoyl] glucosamine N-acyltransferase
MINLDACFQRANTICSKENAPQWYNGRMRTIELAQRIGAVCEAGPAYHDEAVGMEVNEVSSFAAATPLSLVFVEHPRFLEAALQSRAGAIIVPLACDPDQASKPSDAPASEGLPTDAPPTASQTPAAATASRKVLLRAKNPRLAFALAAAELRRRKPQQGGVHPTAVIDPSAVVDPTARIDALSVVGAAATIGPRTHLGPACIVGPGVVIGEDCELVARVTIYTGTTLGDRVVVKAGAVLGSDGFGFVPDPATGRYHQFPQIGRLEIGSDVEIGANTTVDRGALDATVIADGVKIDNLVQVGHNVHIGRNVVIASQTGISGSTVIEDNVIVGGQVGLGDHARIEQGAILGSQCGVLSKKIVRGKGVVFWGTPARPLAQYLKELAAIARLTKKK